MAVVITKVRFVEGAPLRFQSSTKRSSDFRSLSSSRIGVKRFAMPKVTRDAIKLYKYIRRCFSRCQLLAVIPLTGIWCPFESHVPCGCDDAVDAVVGLFGIIEVVTGRRQPGEPSRDRIRKPEGWIFGLQSDELHALRLKKLRPHRIAA
jgi:hypothetical protein